MNTVRSVKIRWLLALLLLLAGCAGYGSLKTKCLYDCQQDLQAFLDAFEEYHVYYAGQDTDLPAALLFDPKEDDRQILPGRWKPLTSRVKARHVLSILEADIQFPPKLYAVLSENHEVFGYLFTSYDHVPIEQVSPKEVEVNYLRQPRHLQYDSDAGAFRMIGHRSDE